MDNAITVIGERINSSRKNIKEAIEKRNYNLIVEEAKKQVLAGADYIDVNVGNFVEQEEELLAEIAKLLQDNVDAPLVIDTPNAKAAEKAVKECRKTPIINSISLESNRYSSMLSIVKEYNTKVIGLCMDDSGVPMTKERRISIAEKLANGLVKGGISEERIYIDPLIVPLSTDSMQAKIVLEVVSELRRNMPAIHLVCGLSNISYGLPSRKAINRVFAISLLLSGMDTFILDPLENKLMSDISVAHLILGKDELCMRYLQNFREGKIVE